MMNNNFVWCVSYIRDNYGEEQIVTLFDNKDAAEKMYEYYENIKARNGYRNVCIDKCEVFSRFYTPDEVEKMSPEESEKLELRDE